MLMFGVKKRVETAGAETGERVDDEVEASSKKLRFGEHVDESNQF